MARKSSNQGRSLAVSFRSITGESRQVYDLDRGSDIKTLSSCINFEPTNQAGKIQISKGFTLVCDLGTYSPLQNMKITKDDTDTSRFTAISAGNVFDISDWASSATSSQKASGLKSSGFIDIVATTKSNTTLGTSTNFLTLLDGVLNPQKYDYSSLTAFSLSTAPQIANKGIYIHDRLWTDDVSQPALIHGSKAFVVDDFTGVDDAVFYQLGDNGNPLTAFTSLFMPADNSTHIFAAKKDELWAISGTEPSDFQEYQISAGEQGVSVGTQSPQGLLSVSGEIIILDNDSPKRYSTVISQSGVLRPQEIALPVKDMWEEDVNKDSLSNGFMCFSSKDGIAGRIYSFIPNVINTCNEAFVYDRVGAWFRRQFWNYSFTCYAIDPDTHDIYLGDPFGRIFKFNDGYTYNNDSYNCVLDFGWIDFNAPGIQKTGTPFSFLETDIYADTSIALNIIKKARNGNITEEITKNFNLKRQEFKYGISKYGESFYTSKSTEKSYFSLGSFDTCKVQMLINNNGANFTINQLYLTADPGNVL